MNTTTTAEPVRITNIRLPWPGCQPSKALSRDETRPALTHGWLKQRDDGLWLFATDSYIAVALKVRGDDLIEGIIPRKALKAIERQEAVSQLGPSAWSVARGAYTQVTYDLGDRVPLDRMPDFDKVANGAMFADDGEFTGEPFGLHSRNVHLIGKALGEQGLHFLSGGGTNPVRVLGQNMPECRGLIMPVRLQDRTKPYTADVQR